MAKEINKELIEKQAKEILDKFAHALEKVGKDGEIESYVDREEFERREKISSSFNDENSKNFSCGVIKNFKDKILKNAPSHDEDFIIAEKGGWK